MAMQQKQNRIAPVAKPQGLDPIAILNERENRYFCVIFFFALNIWDSFVTLLIETEAQYLKFVNVLIYFNIHCLVVCACVCMSDSTER